MGKRAAHTRGLHLFREVIDSVLESIAGYGTSVDRREPPYGEYQRADGGSMPPRLLVVELLKTNIKNCLICGYHSDLVHTEQ